MKDAVALLLEVGYSKSFGEVNCSSAEFNAASALVEPDKKSADLVRVLCSLDSEMMYGVTSYSNASVSTDKAHLALKDARNDQTEREVRRAVVVESQALEAMLDESSDFAARLRKMLIARLDNLGVKCPAVAKDCLKSYDHLRTLISSARGMRKSMARHRNGHCSLSASVPEAYKSVVEELSSAGINEF